MRLNRELTHTRHTPSRGIMVTICLAVWLIASSVAAQVILGQGQQAPVPCSKAMQGEIIDSIAVALREVYVFPDVAEKMVAAMEEKHGSGGYGEDTTVQLFARGLTEDLRDVSKDLHIGVRFFSDEQIAEMSEELTDEQQKKVHQKQLEQAQRQNFAFREVKFLPGNVGYLRFDNFRDASEAAPTAIAAMNFLAYSDALIIDLRNNGGGSPSMIQLISSYFFDEPVHLNTFYIRKTDSLQQFWTQSQVIGPRMTDVDIYVLTSDYTFSGAEEFSYNLKNLKRATIVGDTTGGGAHPVETHYWANLNIGMRIPYGRAINPISGTNWEGTGVAPDIVIASDSALDRAYLEALTKLKEKTEDPGRLATINWSLLGLKAKFNPVTLDSETLNAYAGQYEDRQLRMEDGHLVYQRGDRPPMVMVPLTEHVFGFDDIEWFRLEVVTDDAGRPVKVVGHYDNGYQDESMRTSDT